MSGVKREVFELRSSYTQRIRARSVRDFLNNLPEYALDHWLYAEEFDGILTKLTITGHEEDL